MNKEMDINTRFCSICNQPGNRYSWDHIVKPFHKKRLIAKLRAIKHASLEETHPPAETQAPKYDAERD